MKFSFDPNQSYGPIRPLHGVNNSPVVLNQSIPSFTEAGIPYMRTHDTAYAYGGSRYIDIPNIFPDFDADETDPAAYDFAFTDAYLQSVVASGTKIFYRLGVTIENNFHIKAYHIHPPKNYGKWARICEHIIRHYNEGWANGYHYDIEYWEIWNEPENPPMWTGSREQFFELYSVTANHLKACFPHIKVGGYAGCGFYYITGQQTGDFYKSFITFFDEFLDYICAPTTRAPLDFYSWHLYTENPHLIEAHAAYVRQKLDEKGFTNTEQLLNEWNRIERNTPETYEAMQGEMGASFVAEALTVMQKAGIDKAMYYDATPTRAYCGLYTFPGRRLTKTYYSLYAFNRLYRLGNCVGVEVDSQRNVSALAAAGPEGVAILLSNYGDTAQTVTLNPKGADAVAFSVILTDATHTFEKTEEQTVTLPADITLPPYSVLLLEDL